MAENKKVIQILDIFKSMESDRQVYQPRWSDAFKFVLQKPDPFVMTNPGSTQPDPEIFNSVATESWKNLTSSIHGSLTNISSKWAQVKVQGNWTQKETYEWFDMVGNKMLDLLNSTCYGFPVANFTNLQMMIGVGPATMFIEDSGDKGIRFKHIPIQQVFVEQDAWGDVDTVAIKFQLSARQAIQAFGSENLDEKTIKANEKSPNTMYNFLHFVCPKSDYISDTEFAFDSYYINMEHRGLISQKGFHTMPYIIGEIDRLPTEKYGIGLSFGVMPEIKMVNEIDRTGLATTQLQATPPMLLSDDGMLMKDIQISPGAPIFNAIDAVTGQDKIRPLQIGGAINSLLISIERAEQRIRNAFFYDKLLDAQGPARTATETLQIRDERLRNISPYVQKVMIYLNKVFERVFDLMLRRGDFGPLPDELKGIKLKQGNHYKIEYLSPMANLAKLEEAQSITRSISLVAPLVQAHPEMLDFYNYDQLMTYAQTAAGLPFRLMASQQQVDAIRQQRQKNAQLQQALQLAQASAQLSTPLKTNNPI